MFSVALIEEIIRIHKAKNLDIDFTPQDFPQVKSIVLNNEFQREVELLESALHSEIPFIDFFKARCKTRALDQDQFLPFMHLPSSPTNTMYWDIALALDPQSMGEVLSLLVPQCTHYLAVNEILPFQATSAARVRAHLAQPVQIIPPEISIHPLETLYQKPSKKFMLSMVLAGDLAFDLNQLNGFSIKAIAFILDFLQSHHPMLYEKLKFHNTSVARVLADAATLKNDQIKTPRQALQELAYYLRLGGTHMTGDVFASPIAAIAVGNFTEYYLSLPQGVIADLRILKTTTGMSLGQIIDTYIIPGECVETTATDLREILEHPENQAILDKPVPLSAEVYQRITKTYGYKKSPLHPLKEDALENKLPPALLKEAMGRIHPETKEQFIVLIISFPTTFYTELFASIVFSNTCKALAELALCLSEGFFNREQKNAITDALICKLNNDYDRLDLLSFAMQSQDPDLFSRVLTQLSPDTLLDIIFTLESEEQDELFYELKQPDLFLTLLQKIPESNRIDFLRIKYHSAHRKLLSYALSDADCFNSMLALLPPAEYPQLLDIPMGKGLIPLAYAAKIKNNTAVFKQILCLYPIEQRLEAVIEVSRHCCNLSENLELLKVAMESLRPQDRLKLIENPAPSGITLIHRAISRFEILEYLLGFYPAWQHRDLFQRIDTPNASLFHLACMDHRSIEYLFGQYPEAQHFELLKILNPNKKPLISYVFKNTDLIRKILYYYPKEQRRGLLEEPFYNGESIIDYLEKNIALIPLALAEYPENERFTLLLKPEASNTNNVPLLVSVLENKALFEEIMTLLPAIATQHDWILQAKQWVNLFYYGRFCLNEIEKLYQLLSDTQKEILLQQVDAASESLLIRVCHSHDLVALLLAPLRIEQKLSLLLPRQDEKNHLLYKAFLYPKTLDCLLNEIPKPKLIPLLTNQDSKGINLMHEALNHPHALEVLLSKFSVDELRSGLEMLPYDGKSVIEKLLLKTPFFLSSLDISLLFKLLQIHGAHYELLFYFVDDTKRFIKLSQLILDQIPSDQRLSFLLIKNALGKTFLELALNQEDLTQSILASIAPQDLKRILSLPADQEKTLLDNCMSNSQCFRLLLPIYTDEEKIALIEKGCLPQYPTLLHKFADNPQLLADLIHCFKDDAYLTHLILITGFTSKSALDLALSNDNTFEMLLQKIPPKMRLAILLGQHSKGLPLLDQVKQNPAILKIMLENLEPAERLELLQSCQTLALSFNEWIPRKNREFTCLLQVLSPQEQACLLNFKTDDGAYFWHNLASDYTLFEKIILSTSDQVLVNLLYLRADNGDTVFHASANDDNSLFLLYKLAQRLQLTEICELTNDYRESVFHLAISNPASMRFLLNQYPPEERLQRLLHRDIYELSVAQKAIFNVQTMEVILQSLSNKDKIILLEQANAFNIRTEFNTLSDLFAFPDLLDTTLNSYSPIQQQQAILLILHPDFFGANSLLSPSETPALLMKLLHRLDKEQRTALLANTSRTNKKNVISQLALDSNALEALIDLMGNAILKKAIFEYDPLKLFAQMNEHPQSMELLLGLFTPEELYTLASQRDSLGSLKLTEFISKANVIQSLFNKLSLSDRVKLILLPSNSQRSLLQEATSCKDLFRYLFNQLPPDHQEAALVCEDSRGFNLFYSVADQSCEPELFIELFQLIPENRRRRCLNKNPANQPNLLARLYHLPEVLTVILPYYSEEEFVAIYLSHKLQKKLLKLKTPQSLELIINKLPPHQRLSLLTKSSNHGNTLLKQKIECNEWVDLLLGALASDEERKLFLIKSRAFTPALRKNPKLVKTFFGYFNDEELLQFLMEHHDKDADLAMHECVNCPEILNLILQRYRFSDSLKEVKIRLNKRNETLLHKVRDKTSLQLLIGLYSPQELLQVLTLQSDSGNTVLHELSMYPHLLAILLPHLYQNRLAELLCIRNYAHRTPFSIAASTPGAVSELEKHLSPDFDLEPQFEVDVSSAEALLISSAEIFDAFKFISSKIPRERIKALLLKKQHYGLPCICYTLKNRDCLELALSNFSSAEVESILECKIEDSETFLDRAMNYPDSFAFLLQTLSSKKRVALFKTIQTELVTQLNQNYQSWISLIKSLNYFDLVAAINELLICKNELLSCSNLFRVKFLSAVLINLNPLDRFHCFQKILSTTPLSTIDIENTPNLLWFFTNNQIQALLETTDPEGNTLLHGLDDENTITQLLDIYPKHLLPELLNRKNKDGQTIFLHAIKKAGLFESVMRSFSDTQAREFLLTQTAIFGESAFQLAANFNYSVLEKMLGYYHEQDQRTILQSLTTKPVSPLSYFTTDIQVFLKSLRLYPQADRLNHLLSTDDQGECLLNRFYDDTYALVEIMDLLPAEEREKALLSLQKDGKTLLHLIVAIPHVFQAMQHYISRESLSQFLMDDEKSTDLLFRFNDIRSLKSVIACIPEEKRLQLYLRPNTKNESLFSAYHAYYNQIDLFLLKSLPVNDRLLALLHNQPSDPGILYQLEDNKKIVSCLRLLPDYHRLEFVKALLVTMSVIRMNDLADYLNYSSSDYCVLFYVNVAALIETQKRSFKLTELERSFIALFDAVKTEDDAKRLTYSLVKNHPQIPLSTAILKYFQAESWEHLRKLWAIDEVNANNGHAFFASQRGETGSELKRSRIDVQKEEDVAYQQ